MIWRCIGWNLSGVIRPDLRPSEDAGESLAEPVPLLRRHVGRELGHDALLQLVDRPLEHPAGVLAM